MVYEGSLRPVPYIQNHINWCWATAAKIVGLHYRALMGYSRVQWPEKGVPRSDRRGLRPEYVRYCDGVPMVDSLQAMIVEAAQEKGLNADGNSPMGDAEKIRALKYVVSGNPHSTEVSIRTLGYVDSSDLLEEAGEELVFVLNRPSCTIGNYQRITGDYHSLVLLPKDSGIILYDPWDGFCEWFTVRQVFSTGFLLNTGPGIIRWIQYIQ